LFLILSCEADLTDEEEEGGTVTPPGVRTVVDLLDFCPGCFSLTTDSSALLTTPSSYLTPAAAASVLLRFLSSVDDSRPPRFSVAPAAGGGVAPLSRFDFTTSAVPPCCLDTWAEKDEAPWLEVLNWAVVNSVFLRAECFDNLDGGDDDFNCFLCGEPP